MWEELSRSLENSGQAVLAAHEGNAQLGRFLVGYLVKASKRLATRLSIALGYPSRLDRLMGK